MKKSFFGYSVSEVDDKVESLEQLIELQRKDIEFLKRDNDNLRSVLDEISSSGRFNRE